jgi:hypothetical protein
MVKKSSGGHAFTRMFERVFVAANIKSGVCFLSGYANSEGDLISTGPAIGRQFGTPHDFASGHKKASID